MKKRTIVLLLALLITASVGLAGCRRQEVIPTVTPAVERQLLPAVNTGSSPLPTPGIDNSPVQP